LAAVRAYRIVGWENTEQTMRISIWQQFASNHSASFTVVGEFQDAQSANSAAEVFRTVAKSIDDWYTANETIREAVIDKRQEAPTPAELQVCEAYGITCERALDWLANCGFHETIVSVYNNCVFVTNRGYLLCEGWAGEALFDQLVAKFALRTFIDEENSTVVVVTLTCTAPDPAVAQAIQAVATAYLLNTEQNIFHEIPWIETYLRKQPQSEQTLRDYRIDLKRHQAEIAWDEAHKGELEQLYEQAGISRGMRPPPPQADRIQQEFYARKARDLETVEELDLLRSLPVSHARAELYADIPWWGKGEVEVDDTKIALRGIRFSNISTGLPTVVAWLREQGCTDITYQFEQH
jgi:hypothetical protein